MRTHIGSKFIFALLLGVAFAFIGEEASAQTQTSAQPRMRRRINGHEHVTSRQVDGDCPIRFIEPVRKAQEALQSAAAFGSCDGGNEAITAAELSRADCRSPVDFVGKLSDLGGANWNEIGKDFFFQGLIGNSHRQAACRANFINDYGTNAEKRTQLNEKAKAAFNSTLQDLKDLIQVRDEYEAHLASVQSDTSRLTDKGTFALHAEAVENSKKEVAEIEQAIARLLLAVPMGYEPDVAKAFVEMGERGSFDEGKFQNAMVAAQAKYLKAAEYYQGKYRETQPAKGSEPAKGNYCYGLDFKNLVGSNGEIERWLPSVPEPGLRAKMACQMTTYTKGRYRLTAAGAVIGYAAMMFPAGRLAQAGSKAAWLVFGAATAAEAASTLMSMNTLRELCFGGDVLTSSDQNACDPEKDFQREMNPKPIEACAIGGILTAGGGIGSAIRRIRQARAISGAGASQAGASATGAVSANQSLGRATMDRVKENPKDFSELTGGAASRVEAMAGNGRLRMVRISQGAENRGVEDLAVKPVPGRYYVVVKSREGLVLSDYPLRHGGHRKLAAEMGLPPPRKLDTDGTSAGGVIFYDDGVVVSGQSLRYPNQQSANEIARELRRMGFKILDKKPGPIHGPNSTEKNPFDARNMPLGP